MVTNAVPHFSANGHARLEQAPADKRQNGVWAFAQKHRPWETAGALPSPPMGDAWGVWRKGATRNAPAGKCVARSSNRRSMAGQRWVSEGASGEGN